LGMFVIAGAALLVFALYFIGSRQNLFGSSFMLKVRFHNVNGLMEGNNVRFAGIDVGTVGAVDIENDSTVIVTMVLEERMRRFLRRNSIASVGTDGLMGNKLVNINSSGSPGEAVTDGDVLESLRPIEMDEMVRTLSVTNDNVMVVTRNLRVITDNISNRNSFWHLLADTSLAQDVRNSVSDFRSSARNTSILTGNVRDISGHIRSGRGIGALIRDSVSPGRLRAAVASLQGVADSAGRIASGISSLVNAARGGQGSIGSLLADSTLVYRLNRAAVSADSGAMNFNENMKALQHTWPLKKYFRKRAAIRGK
jgi:phospholipid/cholesterol/gamma-HCH transport system substrate-binding protein